MILEQRNTFKFEGLFVMKPINVKISEPRGNSLMAATNDDIYNF